MANRRPSWRRSHGIGGVAVAAETGLPVVDADGMGRAFPELSMETFAVYGVHGSPLALAGERGERVIIDTGEDDRQMELLARAITIRLGGVGHIAEYAMTGADVRRTAIPRTLSMGLALGRAIWQARERKTDPFEAIADTLSTTLYNRVVELFRGKVIDVERRTTEGFAKGVTRIASDDDELVIRFQNENLTAERGGRLLAIVPDLICVLEAETAEPITTEGLRYGQRVRVIGISTPDMTATTRAAIPPRQHGSDASLRQRLALAQQRIRELEADNDQLRAALAQALGDQRVRHAREPHDDKIPKSSPR